MSLNTTLAWYVENNDSDSNPAAAAVFATVLVELEAFATCLSFSSSPSSSSFSFFFFESFGFLSSLFVFRSVKLLVKKLAVSCAVLNLEL
jgi:hypothetical protein